MYFTKKKYKGKCVWGRRVKRITKKKFKENGFETKGKSNWTPLSRQLSIFIWKWCFNCCFWPRVVQIYLPFPVMSCHQHLRIYRFNFSSYFRWVVLYNNVSIELWTRATISLWEERVSSDIYESSPISWCWLLERGDFMTHGPFSRLYWVSNWDQFSQDLVWIQILFWWWIWRS